MPWQINGHASLMLQLAAGCMTGVVIDLENITVIQCYNAKILRSSIVRFPAFVVFIRVLYHHLFHVFKIR